MSRAHVLAAALVMAGGNMSRPAYAQRAPLWGPLEPGSYGVGFRHIWTLDESRVWERSEALDSAAGTVARPIRIDVWYPARCESREPMPFGTYLEVDPALDGFEDAAQLVRSWDERSYRRLTGSDDLYATLMATATGACWEPPPTSGRYPLILYSAGWYNRSPDNTVIAEYLAAHGFVVATVPQLNPGLWTSDFRSHPAAVETQMRDLEFALGIVLHEPYVDRTRMAAVGYSKGGDVALLIQGRNGLIDAVVGLDPSFALGEDQDVITSPYFDIDRNRVPILVLRRPADGDPPPQQVLDSLAFTQRLLVVIPGSDHGSFGDDPPILAHLGKGNPAASAAHAKTAGIVLRFLQYVLVGEQAPLESSRVEDLVGVEVAAEFLDAAPVPDTEGWAALVAEVGHAEAARRAEELSSEYPNLEIVRERQMNALGYSRLRNDDPALAVELFWLNALAHPASANAYDSLADGCLALGDQECAMAAFRALLEALPADQNLPPAVKEQMRARAADALGQ